MFKTTGEEWDPNRRRIQSRQYKHFDGPTKSYTDIS
jgi:hypothetical protein